MNVLLLRLEAPLLAFGGVAVDNFGVIDALPSASLLTGLFANALGYRRTEHERLQRLQERLSYAVRVDRAGALLTDFQTAQINKDDKAWTTRGVVQTRAGGSDTYRSPHLRYRSFHADAAVSVAVSLTPDDEMPTVQALAAALDTPARPLFIGRKACLPSGRIVAGLAEVDDLLAALRGFALAEDHDDEPRCFLRATADHQDATFALAGKRNWRNDVHQGAERWREVSWRTLR